MNGISYELEQKRFMTAWRNLTGRRVISSKTDRKKLYETIITLHKAINQLCQTQDEKLHCHNDLYGKYLKFVSDDFDRIQELRGGSMTPQMKFDRLLGWCNKKTRAEDFVSKAIAEYEKGFALMSVNPPRETYNDIEIGGKIYHFLIKDQFGRYYYRDGKFSDIIVVKNGEMQAVDFKKFMLEERPRAHKVNITYIQRRIRASDDRTEHQLRFFGHFKQGDSESSLFPRGDKQTV